MTMQRKLGKPTDQRMALLRGQVTALLLHGKIETTYHRAMEVRRIAEKLIADAVREDGNYTSRQMKVSSPKVDGKGKKVLVAKTSRNGAKYYVVDREIRTELRTVDAPSRLHARRKALALVYRAKDADGKPLNVVNKLYDNIAPRFKGVSGGYTRIYKLGPRRGDAAEMALLELVK